MTGLAWLNLALGAALSASLFGFALVSAREEEHRATRVSIVMAVLVPIPFVLVGLLSGSVLQWLLPAATGALALLPWLPFQGRLPDADQNPSSQIDERTIMFSRKRLKPGTDRFEGYYAEFPEHREADDAIRRRPGLLKPGATLHDPVTSAAADAAFDAVAAFHGMLDDDPASGEPYRADPGATSRFLSEWITHMGAHSVGFTEVRDYHLYSRIGRGERYGEDNDIDHSFAIAFTVEMDKRFVDRGPKGPTVMESARQYLNSGAIAVVVARFLQKLGYAARAHIDGSYRVVCPLVARDAGLGEIGRMGLLMTPDLGPRVRLAVVTTDMPLVVSERDPDPSMIDFCMRCKKCADACPSRAISFEDRSLIDAAERWQIDSEACFEFWNTIGTDCARCMSVCPYSHPDTFYHRVVRSATKRSGLAREAALKLDDVFYGRTPAPPEVQEWVKGMLDGDDAARAE